MFENIFVMQKHVKIQKKNIEYDFYGNITSN